MPNISKAVSWAVSIANDNSHGYDQANRNGPDYDCSSLISTVLYNAGFSVSPNSWTGNMYDQLVACGFKECSAPWLPGDVHLNFLNHVAMSVTEGTIVEASINERGGITGGQTGDQTGNEIHVRSYYSYPWDVHLRYSGDENNYSNPDVELEQVARDVIAGKYGVGQDRIDRLMAAGFNYYTVQEMVNKMLTPGYTSAPSVELGQVARDVIAGKYGNGSSRKQQIEAMGLNYAQVQLLVNQMLEGN